MICRSALKRNATRYPGGNPGNDEFGHYPWVAVGSSCRESSDSKSSKNATFARLEEIMMN